MNKILIACAVVSFLPSLFAEKKTAEGGLSPDGKYEVQIINAGPEPNYYHITIARITPFKRLYYFPDIGGYLSYNTALEEDKALWHSSSKFVAITDRVVKRCSELYVAAIVGDKVSLLKQPDFLQNALGRVGAVEIDRASFVKPQKWDGDDLILEICFTANGGKYYTFEVVLHLVHEANYQSWLQLKSVKKLKEEEG